jgi:hypothetical protein
MNLNELYDALSARITAAVVNHQTIEWADYFSQMREVIRSVAAESTDSSLSATDKAELVRRLIAHVDELERSWPNLKPK